MATAPLSEVERLQSEIETLQDENRASIERLTALENELARKDEIIHENTEQKDKLLLDIKEKKKEIDQLQARLQEDQDQKRSLMERLSALKNELDITINENARLNTEKDKLSEQVYQLQNQLEQAEEEAFNAKGDKQKLKGHLEEIQVKCREAESELRNFQSRIKEADANIEESEENYHMTMAELKGKTELVIQLERECKQIKLESSSRQANLNQALLHTKHVCIQLEARNEELEAHERMLIEEKEALESRCMELSSRLEGPCQLCRKREHAATVTIIPSNSKDDEDLDSIPRSYSTPVTPFKTLPEETEVDRLNDELLKKKQEHDCLFENLQMVSKKNTTLKKELKESEKALYELQSVCDSLKDELEVAYREPRHTLDSSISGKNPKQIQQEAESLMKELSGIQMRHDELLAKNSSLKVEKIDNERSLEDAHRKLDRLMEELRSYRESSSSSDEEPRCDQHMETIAACKSALDKSKKERDWLREANTELEKLAATLKEENEALGTQNTQLRLTISDNEADKTAIVQLESELEAKGEEIVTLQSKVAVVSKEKSEVLKEDEELKKALRESQSQNHDLNNSLAKLKAQNKRDQELVTIQQKEIETERAKATHINQELAASKRDLELAKNCIKRLQHDIESNAKCHDDVENQLLKSHNKLSQLQMRLGELEGLNYELKSTLESMKTQETSLVSKSNRSKMKIEELNEKLKATEEVLEEKERELNLVIKSREQLKIDNNKLLEQLDQLSQALMASNNEKDLLRGQIEQYDTELEVARASHELDFKEKEAKIADLNSAIEDLDSENESLNTQVILLKEEISACEERLSTVRLDAENKSRIIEDFEENEKELKMELQEMTAVKENLFSRSERQESDLLNLTEQMKHKSEELRQANREITRLKVELKELQQSHSNELEHSVGQYYKLKEENDHIDCENRHLQFQLSQAARSLEDLEDWKRGVVERSEELERKLEERERKIEELKRKIEELKNDKARLQRELKETRQRHMQHKRDYKLAEDIIKKRKQLEDIIYEPDTPTSERIGEGVQQYNISSTSGE
ncbi:PREDICTED: myosin-11-like [Amphimedon queenslandica]|uniref:Myosin tail domain-containing protein n=1 Tax=Amphimedon queenslandica TaxID=400682 RepID=A0A1X7VEH1_AMPQE|nr:PREDICTED: myosin-11-like [Amphimedon queenslandica]|eukprot:XP_011410511.1 PREDICTED: myosin-11-like [Amphimedon queenslandica]